MPFANGDTTKTQIHETLKLLHDTIKKQTEATNRQSTIMIWLTTGLFVLAIVQILLLLFQIFPSVLLQLQSIF
jgi:hypothetical protein